MKYIVHIETSTKMCSVALSGNGKIIDYRNYMEDGYAHSEKLTVLLEELLSACNVKFKELAAISISGGPGSYTGLRIGVSTAKGLCYALKIPLLAIDSLKCLALWSQMNEEMRKADYICPLIDARRMEVFSAVYDKQLSVLKPISADIIEEDSYSELFGDKTVVLLGDGAEKLKEKWEGRTNLIFSGWIADARGQAEEAFKMFEAGTFSDLAYYEPFYLKDFIAGKKKG